MVNVLQYCMKYSTIFQNPDEVLFVNALIRTVKINNHRSSLCEPNRIQNFVSGSTLWPGHSLTYAFFSASKKHTVGETDLWWIWILNSTIYQKILCMRQKLKMLFFFFENKNLPRFVFTWSTPSVTLIHSEFWNVSVSQSRIEISTKFWYMWKDGKGWFWSIRNQ